MCLARIRFSGENEGAEVVAADVARVEVVKQGLIITGLMGETRKLRAAIKSIDFMESTVVIEKKEE